jgi:hypothetical protein
MTNLLANSDPTWVLIWEQLTSTLFAVSLIVLVVVLFWRRKP